MARTSALIAVGIVLMAANCAWASQTDPTDPNTDQSPLVEYLSFSNSSLFGTTWLAIQAAHLDKYLNDPNLAITFFVPTNEAWEKRISTLTKMNDISVYDLFSEGRSPALAELLKYHILQGFRTWSSLTGRSRVSSLANLCSDAKDLGFEKSDNQLVMQAAGNTVALVLDRGMQVGKSLVFPIDDILLPAAVTITLHDALQGFCPGNGKMRDSVYGSKSTLDKLNGIASSTPIAALAPAAPEDMRNQIREAARSSSVSSQSANP